RSFPGLRTGVLVAGTLAVAVGGDGLGLGQRRQGQPQRDGQGREACGSRDRRRVGAPYGYAPVITRAAATAPAGARAASAGAREPLRRGLAGARQGWRTATRICQASAPVLPSPHVMSCLPRLGAFLFLLLSLAACAAAPARTAKEPAYTPLLLVSVDGLRADALGRGDTPVLDALAREGVQAEGMRPSFPALTFPNHYTLVTGLRPDHHGVVHNSMKDPQLGRFVVADKQAATVAGWWQAEPLWTTAERAGIATAVWAWPGATAERDGVLPRQGQAFDANIPLDERVERVATWVAAPQGPRPGLVAMYFEMVDGAGHDHGPGSEQARAAIRTVDAAIGQLLARLEAAGVVPNVVVVSDHGMADARNFLAVEDIAAMEEAEVVSIGQVIGLVPRAGYG